MAKLAVAPFRAWCYHCDRRITWYHNHQAWIDTRGTVVCALVPTAPFRHRPVATKEETSLSRFVTQRVRGDG